MFVLKKIAHTYWIPSYYKISYRWVSFSFSVPYVYFKWVPSYKMFGWLRIPGHYEPRIGWKRIFILGLASGISEGIGLLSASRIALGGISLVLAYRELYDVYHDPWIEVTVDGHKLWLT